MNAHLPVARISDDEFEAMIGKGAAAILGRVELREGTLYRMNAQYAPHTRMKVLLFKALDQALVSAGLGLEANIEGTVRYGGGFSPLPDVFIWAPEPSDASFPGHAVKLVAEVADSTLADDLGDKRAAYAKAGLPEYWVVDLKARALHRFSEPVDGEYARAAVFREGEGVAAETLAGVDIVLKFPG